jgi:hypothetical protein
VNYFRIQDKAFNLVLLLFAIQSSVVSGQEKIENENLEQTPPTVIFSTMLWQGENSEIFSFAPWDNHEDENATMIEISATSGIVSRKFAYYGDGALRFLQSEDLLVDEPEVDSNSSFTTTPRKVLANCKFQIIPGQTKEYLLLVEPIKGDEAGAAKIYTIPFDQENIPTGSFAFSSRSNKTLYVQFGQSKFAVPPRSSVVKKAQVKEGSRSIPLKVFLKQGGKYEVVLSKEWPHSDALRGLVYLTETPSGVQVTRIADFPQSVEQAMGFGSAPTRITPKKPDHIDR